MDSPRPDSDMDLLAPERENRDRARQTPPGQTRRANLLEGLTREIAWLAGTDPHSISVEHSLEALGLDSLGAVDLTTYLERHFDVKLSPVSLFGSMTLGQLVTLAENPGTNHDARTGASPTPARAAPEGAATERPAGGCAVVLRDWKIQSPLFCIPGVMGVATYLSRLGAEFRELFPLIAFQAPGIDGTEAPLGSVEEMARRYIDEMRAIQPEGPYKLAGHSFGGLVAHEMARRLHEQGERVDTLLLIDALQVRGAGERDGADADLMALYELYNIHQHFAGEPGAAARKFASLSPEKQYQALAREMGTRTRISVNSVLAVHRASYTAMKRFRSQYYPGPATLLRARSDFPARIQHPARDITFCTSDPALGWQGLCASLRITEVPGDHLTMVRPPHVKTLGRIMRQALDGRPRLSLGLERLRLARSPGSPERALEVSSRGVSFDPYHPVHVDDPYPILAQVRAHAPVLKNTMSQWWLTRHAEVSAGLRDKRFGVDPRGLSEAQPRLEADISRLPFLSALRRQHKDPSFSQHLNRFMLFLDPPRHQRLRRVFSPLFTPEAVRHWTGYIDECVEALIGDLRQHPEADLVKALALPLPAAAISKILGFPREDLSLVLPWAQDLIAGFDPLMSEQTASRINQSAEEFSRYIREHLQTQRRAGRAAAEGPTLDPGHVLDQGLGLDELTTHYALLFAVGFETTTDMIGNSALALLRNPDQLERWRAHPELTGNAVEELLRYESPVRCSIRYALEDLDFGGQRIRRGEMVVFSFSGANRDPRLFPDPDRLDIGRDARRHVAFAHGAHYCLGAHLARIELQRVLPALIRHDFSLAPGGTRWRPSMVFRGLETLRIRNH